MSKSIFQIDNSGKLVELKENLYESEDLLQGLLERHPNLLAGDQIDRARPRRWLLVSREASIPDSKGASGRWSVDHLFLDQDAIPTLVEVKRSTDTRVRREVVGQMLDYAANAVVYWPVEHLKSLFEKTCLENGQDADQELILFLEDDLDDMEYWQKVKTNLQAGKIRLVFVADQIPMELQRIVEFLNEQCDPAEVIAVEVKQFTADGLRTLVPTVLGQTAEAQTRKRGGIESKIQWTEENFFLRISEDASPRAVSVAHQLLDWGRENTHRIWWGKGKTYGSFVPVLDLGPYKHHPFAVLTTGQLEFYFFSQTRKPPFKEEEMQRELLARFNQVPTISLSEESLNKRPTISLDEFSDPKHFEALVEVFDWYIEKVKAL